MQQNKNWNHGIIAVSISTTRYNSKLALMLHNKRGIYSLWGPSIFLLFNLVSKPKLENSAGGVAANFCCSHRGGDIGLATAQGTDYSTPCCKRYLALIGLKLGFLEKSASLSTTGYAAYLSGPLEMFKHIWDTGINSVLTTSCMDLMTSHFLRLLEEPTSDVDHPSIVLAWSADTTE